ncbi:chemosensory receptor C [Elysia marginata]|uniref:Chemosensory receptor C n=1 Tax=Elysia marginata TaxID=1093978 RepID=A0AAV4FH88_9GAST|nr:chemosensory receptor C [Elysia marginata]
MTDNISSIVPTDRFFGYPYRREFTLVMRYQPPFWTFLLAVGLTTNILNIITFLKVGVKDSVTTLLLTLSMSDASFLILVSPTLLRHGFLSVGSYKLQAFSDLRFITFWPAFTCYDFSAYVSVVLGVTRCACVAMPLRFKSVFTKKRTIISVVVLFCINVLIHIPVLTMYRLGWKTDPLTNKSYVGVVRDEPSLRNYKQGINDIINKNTLQVISFIVLVACAALLKFKLFQASKIRSKLATVSGSSDESDKSLSQSLAASHKLSPKDVRVVQSVILVCSVYIFAQLPSLLYTATKKFHPEFTDTGRLFFLVVICSRTSYTFYLINASVNIFVYYNYNTKFRSAFRSLFKCKEVPRK